MNKKLLAILAILAAIAAGYYFGTQRTLSQGDPVRTQAPVSQAYSQAVVTIAPRLSVKSYILNKSTKKFHKPDCASVKQMKESNKIYFTGTRDEVIADGYEPCGRCHP